MPKPLDPNEHKRRQALLQEISKREQQNGVRVAQSHPNRARQFMPFAALKGYHQLAHERERTKESKHIMTEELSRELSETISRLAKGCMVSVVHYEKDRYTTTCGIVTEIDEAFHALHVVKRKIDFNNIFSVEISD